MTLFNYFPKRTEKKSIYHNLLAESWRYTITFCQTWSKYFLQSIKHYFHPKHYYYYYYYYYYYSTLLCLHEENKEMCKLPTWAMSLSKLMKILLLQYSSRLSVELDTTHIFNCDYLNEYSFNQACKFSYLQWWSQKWSLVDNFVGVYDEVTFLAKMREKNTGVALANSSPMIKWVEFSISLRESECNFVGLNLCTFLSMLGGLFIVLVQLLGGTLWV